MINTIANRCNLTRSIFPKLFPQKADDIKSLNSYPLRSKLVTPVIINTPNKIQVMRLNLRPINTKKSTFLPG